MTQDTPELDVERLKETIEGVLGRFFFPNTDAFNLCRDTLATELTALRARVEGEELRIVFDGFPDHEGPRFIEVETPDGKSINAGEWRRRPDGFCELVITTPPRVEAGDLERAKAALRYVYEHGVNVDRPDWLSAAFDRAYDGHRPGDSPRVEAPSSEPIGVAALGCIGCANGNDLPDGETCAMCGRVGELPYGYASNKAYDPAAVPLNESGLSRAVRLARGSSDPPSIPLLFSAPSSETVGEEEIARIILFESGVFNSDKEIAANGGHRLVQSARRAAKRILAALRQPTRSGDGQ